MSLYIWYMLYTIRFGSKWKCDGDGSKISRHVSGECVSTDWSTHLFSFYAALLHKLLSVAQVYGSLQGWQLMYTCKQIQKRDHIVNHELRHILYWQLLSRFDHLLAQMTACKRPRMRYKWAWWLSVSTCEWTLH